MQSGEPNAKKTLAVAWSLLIAMLPFVILTFFMLSDNMAVMKWFVYLANESYYTIFFAWGWISSMLGNFMTNLSYRKGWIK